MLQCSPYLESYCSKSIKKKIGDREAVGGVFLCEQWLFSPKFRDSQPAGDALNYYFKLHVLQVTRESGK